MLELLEKELIRLEEAEKETGLSTTATALTVTETLQTVQAASRAGRM